MGSAEEARRDRGREQRESPMRHPRWKLRPTEFQAGLWSRKGAAIETVLIADGMLPDPLHTGENVRDTSFIWEMKDVSCRYDKPRRQKEEGFGKGLPPATCMP